MDNTVRAPMIKKSRLAGLTAETQGLKTTKPPAHIRRGGFFTFWGEEMFLSI